jgi:hypothetical protein
MTHHCSVPGCSAEADCEVILYDFYPEDGHVFFERDFTCPFICAEHRIRNEEQSQQALGPLGVLARPYTNLHGASGLTIYRPLDA